MSESPAQRARRALLRKRKEAENTPTPVPVDPRTDPLGAAATTPSPKPPKPAPRPVAIRDAYGHVVGYTVGPSPFGPDTPLPDEPGVDPRMAGATAAAATLKGARS